MFQKNDDEKRNTLKHQNQDINKIIKLSLTILIVLNVEILSI